MSVSYPEYYYSTFPEQLDKQMTIRDPYASELSLIQQYNSLVSSGQSVAAIELLTANPTLMESQMNAEKLLTIHHSILSLQHFFYDSVLEKIYHIGQQKGEWDYFMSTDATDEALHLNMYDIVRYPVDGVSQYFMVISNNIPIGTYPTDTSCYVQLTIKGDKGDTGYTPIKGIDYYDGTSGLGLSPRGAWNSEIEYTQYDLVSHNGYLWYCTENTTGTEPSIDDVWQKIEISTQTAVSSGIPQNLEEGGLWLDLQDDGHVIIKTKNTDGTYSTLFPETKASYITDEIGESLQRKIYRHYFERDDVKVVMEDNDPVYTSTATLLSNSNITVAKSVLTDTSDENGMITEEFTVYDETGIFVMYKCKNVYTIDDENGVYTRTPEVIA